MNFTQWLLQNEAGTMGLQAPTTGQYWKTAAAGLGKAVMGALPFVGTAVDLASTAQKLMQMRQQGQDVTPLILQMMQQQDQGGVPANAFDLDDALAAMLSDPSKMEIAKRIVAKIDTLLAQVQAGTIPDDMANKEAVQYIQTVMSQVQ
jgi:hypothetical protein